MSKSLVKSSSIPSSSSLVVIVVNTATPEAPIYSIVTFGVVGGMILQK